MTPDQFKLLIDVLMSISGGISALTTGLYTVALVFLVAYFINAFMK